MGLCNATPFNLGARMTVKTRKQSKLEFRSNLEKLAWYEWLPTVEHKSAYYEPFGLNCSNGRYTPDIVIVLPDDTLLIVEVKGSWKQKGATASKLKLQVAANEYEWLGKFIALLPDTMKRENGGLKVTKWKTEEIAIKKTKESS